MNLKLTEGDVFELDASSEEEGAGYVLLQVVSEVPKEDVGGSGLYRVIVLSDASPAPFNSAHDAASRGGLFIVCFHLRQAMRAGLVRSLGSSKPVDGVGALGPLEVWNIAMIRTAVERNWRAGDDYELLE